MTIKADEAMVRGEPDITVARGQNGGEGFFGNAAFWPPSTDRKAGEALLRLNRLKDIRERDGGADDLKK